MNAKQWYQRRLAITAGGTYDGCFSVGVRVQESIAWNCSFGFYLLISGPTTKNQTTMLGLVLIALLTIGADGQPSGEGCKNDPADIVFVLDESGSIWGPDFKQQLDFVQKFIEGVDIGLDRTRIGVLAYGTTERVIFQLGQYNDKAQMIAAVKGITQKRGNTRTDLALQRMRKEMFSREYSRPSVHHLAIVITDGDSDYPIKTALEGDILRRETDIEVNAVGVGKSVSRKELQAIATSNNMVFMVDNYAALESLRNSLTWTCPTTTVAPTTTTTPQNTQGCACKMDQIWSISELAGVKDTNYALDLIKKVTRNITALGPAKDQVGLAPRFCADGTEIRLKDHDTLQGFWSDLDRHRLEGAQTHRVINYMRSEGMSAANGGRTSAVKFGILIIDFAFADWQKTLAEAKAAKRAGVKLIVIGVGEDAPQDQLQQLASISDGFYFYVNSYSKLIDLEGELNRLICEGTKSPCPSLRRLMLLERFFDY